jgi:hypothetical protein
MNRSQESSANEQRNDVVSASRLLAPGSSRDVGGVERDSMIQSDHITSARTYREGTANDNSRLHAGDVHSYNWYMAPADTESNTDSPEAKLQRLRSALTYPQMGLRSAIVEDAYLDTCQMALQHARVSALERPDAVLRPRMVSSGSKESRVRASLRL